MLFQICLIFISQTFSKFKVENLWETAKNCFWRQDFELFELCRKWEFNLIQIKRRAKMSIDTKFCHCKAIICTKFTAHKPKIPKIKVLRQSVWEKLCKLEKSCHHNQNINWTYNEELQYNCRQQLRLKDYRKLGNLGSNQFSCWKSNFTVILLKVA